MLTLWYAPGTIALAAHIALEETGAPFTLRRLSFPDGEQRGAAYLALNPKGRVPTLETPQGPLTETLAVLSWIASAYPHAALEPSEPYRRALGLSVQTYLAATVHVNHAHKLRGARWSDDPAARDSMRAKVPQTMAESMDMIEQHLFTGPWVLGADYSTCDPYLFTICRWLPGDSVDLAAFPRLQAHVEAMQARPAVRRALAHHD